VLFSGGPSDGQTDKRISTDGTWDEEITVLAEGSRARDDDELRRDQLA
jgi:hypothetical protein